jgi:iron complex outermembrane receptor protein
MPVNLSIKSKKHTIIPSATVSYKLDDGTVYVRWARGFKSGGINPTAAPTAFPNPTQDGDVFGPEKVDTYEAGYKQSLMDHRLQLTGDIFYNKYNGLQVQAKANPEHAATIIFAIVNAGSAFTYGAEGSATYQVIDPLTVGVNLNYQEGKYSNFTVNPSVLVPENLSHTRLIELPKWQLSLDANYDQPINDRFNLVGTAIEAYTTRQLLTASGLPCGPNTPILPGVGPYCVPPIYGPGYWLTNLRFGVKTNDDAYELVVFADNLFDAKYYTFGSSSSNGNLVTWGSPRVVGAQFTVNF